MLNCAVFYYGMLHVCIYVNTLPVSYFGTIRPYLPSVRPSPRETDGATKPL